MMARLRRSWLAPAVAVSAALLAAGEEDVGYNLLFEDATEEFENRCVKLPAGTKPVPSWAQGDFILPSLGLFEMGNRRFEGLLDGFGKLQRFEIRGDEVCATYKIMNTGFYNDSVKENTVAEGILFVETTPPRKCPLLEPVVCNLFGKNDNTFVNTISLGGELLSITDAPAMLELDRKTLSIKGTKKFSDKLAGLAALSSAHPMRHPETGDWVDFVTNPNMVTGKAVVKPFTVGEKDPSTRREVSVQSELHLDSSPYMHSFGVTSGHIVFPRMPLKMDAMQSALKGISQAFLDLDLKDEGPDNAFFLVPLNGSAPSMHTLPVNERLYYVHTVNSFENASHAVLDITTVNRNPFRESALLSWNKNKTARDTEGLSNVVKRFAIPFHGGPVTSQPLTDSRVETDFTKVNPKKTGRDYCVFWGVQWKTDLASHASMAIAKHNLCTGEQKQWTRKFWYPSEATMIPSSEPNAAEDEGLLVFTALDGANDQTFLIIADAQTMESVYEVGPFPRIAFTTHGEFYPAGLWEQAADRESATPLVV